VSEGGFAHGSISVDTAGNVFTPPSGDRDVAVCPSGDVFTSNGSDRVFRGAGAAASANFLRLAGADRVGTAIQGSWATFDDGEAGAVVLARSDAFPDALAGTPLAAAHHGPLLLTDPATLDDRVLDEISRVLPAGGDVYLLGGNAALAPGIAQALTTAGFRPVRLAGEDRFATAAVIAENGLGSPNSVLLATGSNFPDALAAGAAAASQHAAVLLSAGTSMPAPTSSYLSRHGAQVVAIGGPAAAAAPGADKIVGSDRYDTARRVADRFFPQATLLGIASGLNFPDALAGGAVLGNQGGALLLSPPDALADSAAAYLDGRAAAVLLFGGRAALQDTVRRSAQAALAG